MLWTRNKDSWLPCPTTFSKSHTLGISSLVPWPHPLSETLRVAWMASRCFHQLKSFTALGLTEQWRQCWRASTLLFHLQALPSHIPHHIAASAKQHKEVRGRICFCDVWATTLLVLIAVRVLLETPVWSGWGTHVWSAAEFLNSSGSDVTPGTEQFEPFPFFFFPLLFSKSPNWRLKVCFCL